MTEALILGKFLPPHAGHAHLAQAARAEADHVVVALLANSREPIPVALRRQWLEELLPWAEVHAGTADIPVDYESDAAYDAWAAIIREVTGRERFDVLCTSEPAYGERTAQRLGARHVLVDPARAAVPISATQIRENPWAHWEHLSPAVRAHYARRVCLLGAESTGTTTMTRRLAEVFGTTWVPEYGREYSLPKDIAGDTWTTAEFELIARRQQASEDEAARDADRVLFCDTDALTTAIWHEQYLGERAPSVLAISRERQYDLTFLTAADFPWVQDGTRNSDATRQWMQRRFEEELAARPEPVVELRGSVHERLETALAAIERHLGLRPRAA